MQRSHPTLAFKSSTILLSTLYLLLLHPSYPLVFLVVFLFLLLPLPPLTRSEFYNGRLKIFEPGALNYYTLSHLILRILSVSKLNASSSFQIPESSTLRSDCTHSRYGMFSHIEPHASGGVITFIRQSQFFSKLSTSPSFRLTPTLTM